MGLGPARGGQKHISWTPQLTNKKYAQDRLTKSVCQVPLHAACQQRPWNARFGGKGALSGEALKTPNRNTNAAIKAFMKVSPR